MNIEESKIYHKCSTDKGSSGAPILSLENNKLIGIHYGSIDNANFGFNIGTLIAFPIIDFNNNVKEPKEIPKMPLDMQTKGLSRKEIPKNMPNHNLIPIKNAAVAHQRLVVAFGVTDGPLVGPLAGEFPPDLAHAPVPVAAFLDPLDLFR